MTAKIYKSLSILGISKPDFKKPLHIAE